jgi:hypothetical protein
MLDGPGLAAGVDLDKETMVMRTHRVGAMRVTFYWSDLQPQDASTIDFTAYDPIVLAAALHGIRVMPVVLRTPAWAAADPSKAASPPADPRTYGRLLIALVRRYGPQGTLWNDHPEVHRVPVLRWQIWNEPDLGRFWAAQPHWAPSYVRLLHVAHDAIKAVDPAAKVVSAGVTGAGWLQLEKIYRAGGRRWFDIAGAHPFHSRVAGVLRIVELIRKVMSRNGDGRKPLLLSEITWCSGKGRSTHNYGWETTERGQAARVRQVLPALAEARRRWRIAGIYWYTWVSLPLGSPESFDYAGLNRANKEGVFLPKPALAAWTRTVARLTG